MSRSSSDVEGMEMRQASGIQTSNKTCDKELLNSVGMRKGSNLNP